MNPLSPSIVAKGKVNARLPPFRGGNLFVHSNRKQHNSLGYIIIISFGILLSTIVVLVVLINVTVIVTSSGRKAIQLSRHEQLQQQQQQQQQQKQLQDEQNRKLSLYSSSPKIQQYINCQEQVLQQFTTRIVDPTTPLTNLTEYDYKNSRINIGNQRRLMNFVQSLVGTTSYSNLTSPYNTQTTTTSFIRQQQRHLDQQNNRKPVSVIVCGGSISLGHGVHPESLRYSNRLEKWFNEQFPLTNKNQQTQHRVYNKGSHGADICAMAKRISTMKIPDSPDLFILEFGVNDYQGQDHEIHIDHKTDIFFDGYQKLLVCGEIVIQHLLSNYPKTAIVFLEFSTTILNRKNAQFLHTGIAQHYQIPVISYSNVMIPYFYNLVQQLDPKLLYTIPRLPTTNTTSTNSMTTTPQTTTSQLYSYPHGCTECRYHEIDVEFRPMGCKSICTFMDRSGYPCDYHTKESVPKNRQHCYTSFLAHDAVHPSAVGHAIARDLLINTFQQVAFDMCYHTDDSTNIQQQQYIPKIPGFLASKETIEQHSNFILVQDTMNMFGDLDPLVHVNKSNGFNLMGDGMADRKGYIATNINGNEYVEFDIHMNRTTGTTKQSKLKSPCYVIYIAALKSYENMGKFYVTIIDQITTIETQSTIIDCIWEPHISIPSDIQINYDDYKIIEAVESTSQDDTTTSSTTTPIACTGQCRIRITTVPQDNDRTGINKVKIMTLSVRECILQKSILPRVKKQRQQQQQPAEEIAEWLPI